MIIKEFPCESKIDLLIEEEKLRKNLQATLNTCKSYISKEDYKIERNNYTKDYYINNKSLILEKAKKNYYKLKEKIACECGSIIEKHFMTKHTKTLKHCQFIQN